MIIDLRNNNFDLHKIINDYLKSVDLEDDGKSDIDVSNIVRDIIADVKQNGDEALIKYNKKFDNFDCTALQIKIEEEQINQAYSRVDKELIKSLEVAKNRVENYYHKQKPTDLLYKDEIGMELGWKWNPIEKVGIYVPGGLATYPSSVIMNAVPALVASVKKIVMVTPAVNGKVNDVVLATAKICGISDIYLVGGAQSIAALAYGTKMIEKVDKIVGPGNVFVAEAKKQLFGVVGIDMIAGPSEILVISDKYTDPNWVAIDLLSQAEHDKMARSILITDDYDYATKVADAVLKNLELLGNRTDIARTSWKNNGKIFVVNDLINQATQISNIIAPEHLQIFIRDKIDQQMIIHDIHNAGAIFIGSYSCEALGDYIAGPSHVLPTSATSRFSSGLSVYDFLTRTSIIHCNKDAFLKIVPDAKKIALSENLYAHAMSLSVRQDDVD